MTDIDDQIKKHYDAQSLPDHVTAKLIKASDEISPRETSMMRLMRHGREHLRGLGMAAACLLVAFVWVHHISVHRERTQSTLQEVALNHSTRMELEFTGVDVAALDETMALLPFEVSLPQAIAENYRIQGARYCTIRGQIAAHVKLVHRTENNRLSVFMTQESDELKAVDDSQERVNGLDVEIWRQSGLLYAKVGAHRSEAH